jgi:hypothetical protein
MVSAATVARGVVRVTNPTAKTRQSEYNYVLIA